MPLADHDGAAGRIEPLVRSHALNPAVGVKPPSPPVGVIGLGVMGAAMSRHWLAAGRQVVGYDIDPARLADFEGRRATSVADVLGSGAEVIVLSLPTEDSLDAVSAELAAAATARTAGVGVDSAAAGGAWTVVEMGTFSLAAKERARACLEAAGGSVLDVPVSGTGLQAADATLVVYASGDPDAFRRAEPLLELVGRRTFYLGSFGNGSRMKYVANLLVAVHTLAAAEAHRLAAAIGLDPATTQEVISAGVGSSRLFDIRGPMMVADTYDPPSARLAIIHKDASLIAAQARSAAAATPLLDAALPVYEAGLAAGLGSLDAAALLRVLEGRDGIGDGPAPDESSEGAK